MRFRVHVEAFEIEIGGSDADQRHPAALAFAAAAAPLVVDWLAKRFKINAWDRSDTPPAAATEDDGLPEQPAAAPPATPNGVAPAAAEV